MRTGFTLSNCRTCGTQAKISLDDRWQTDSETKGAYQLVSFNHEPAYCPACGSSSVVFTDEEVDFFEWCASNAGWKLTPETLELVKALYDQWDHTDSFIEFLVEFKRAVVTG